MAAQDQLRNTMSKAYCPVCGHHRCKYCDAHAKHVANDRLRISDREKLTGEHDPRPALIHICQLQTEESRAEEAGGVI